MGKITVKDIITFKGVKKITMLTAYDFQTARIFDKTDLDIILVGDSVGTVFYGEATTIPVTLTQTILHTRAVSHGVSTHALVVGDMPFLTFGVSIEQTVENAGRILKEGGAEAVKLEGGFSRVDEVRALKNVGIPVMGHLGLTPQSVHEFGGHKMQAKTGVMADRLIEEAKALEQAGVFSIVLEAVPWQVAKEVTSNVHVPTIGIGAGSYCDGQVLVGPDMLGMTPEPHPRFVKQYTLLEKYIQEAAKQFIEEVQKGFYPAKEHAYDMSTEEYDQWMAKRNKK